MAAAAGPTSASAASDLPAEMTAVLEGQGLQGAVWSLVRPEGVEIGAAGRRDAATGAAIRADDRVNVGSVTKTLVATGILILVTEGRLSLDAPLADLLPEVALDNPWDQTHPVRLRHLLDHTAGLDDARLWHILSRRAKADTPLAAALTGSDDMLRVRVRPGSRFSYSNLGYHLAGMVMERVTGEPYEAWLDAHLLRPLGMADSTFAFVDQATDPRLAMGHFEAGEPAPALPLWLRTGTQFTTTAADMARFARFLLGEGGVDGRLLVRPDLLRAMGPPAGTEAAEAGLAAGYGMGLDSRDRFGVPARCHSGSMVGFNAAFCLFPDQGKAFFLAMNADSETADMAAPERELARVLDLAPVAGGQAGTPAEGRAADLADWSGTYVPAPVRFQTTAYLDRLTAAVKVGTAGSGVTLTPFQAPPRSLHPVGGPSGRAPDPADGLLFRAEGRVAPSHILYLTATGDRVLSTGFRTWQRVHPLAQGLLWAGAAAGIGGLVWILGSGLVRIRRLIGRPVDPMVPPFLATLALLLPLPFLATGDFLALGDPSPGSLLLAGATAVLPLALLAGLVQGWRVGYPSLRSRIDAAALLAVLQWAATLAAYGLLPLTLWT
jgi:CubicO group peptidase (beta-lactamase class C family)